MPADSLVIIIIGSFTVTSTVVGNKSCQPFPPIGTSPHNSWDACLIV